jgi:hypothetical protein
MPRSIADSVIVITGASTGIGWAAALEFAQAGCSAAFFSRNLYLSKKSRRCVLGGSLHCLRFFSELSSPTRNMSRNPMKRKTIMTPMPNRWLPDQ